ncbi:MAG: hypothetical protein MZV64_12755 [Ignavibacteriales bacterium]|nr:hypothetical protein [Ignavibacteriales bacterium]
MRRRQGGREDEQGRSSRVFMALLLGDLTDSSGTGPAPSNGPVRVAG